MAERTYTNPMTLDGKLKLGKGVSEASLKQAKALMEAALRGDYVADAQLRRAVTAEAYTSSDLAPAVAHLVNLQVIPQLDEPQYSISDWVGAPRTVADFDPAVLYSLYGKLKGAGLDKNGAPVRVPEGTPYPTVTVEGQESFYAKLAKRGLRFDFTWEAQVKDTAGFFGDLPGEIAQLSHDADYAEIFDAVDSAKVATSGLKGGKLPNEETVPADAHISPDAIWEAILELSNREVNGIKIGRLSGYNVAVPVGTKDFIDYQLNRQIVEVQDGNLKVSGASYYQGALASVKTIETPRVTGSQWKMLPKPGATKRPSLELLKLRGYENPELRVRQDGGDSSFDTDTKAFRLRYVVGGALWDDKYVVSSKGTA